VIACLCTSSVGFPDFILRGEVRDTSFVTGMGKILSPARRHPVKFFNRLRQMQVPCFCNAVIRKGVNGFEPV
jgi:hypothetical protein